jgi:hypothetical protein
MDWLLHPYWSIRRHLAKKRFLERLKEEAAEEFLKGLLQLLKISSHVDGYLRQSMRDFNGRIEFKSKNNQIRVLADFNNGRLEERELDPEEELQPPANTSVVFKDAEAVKNFLLPKGGLKGRRDVLRSILKNEVKLEGNYNYIYRFGFLATHLQLQLLKALG